MVGTSLRLLVLLQVVLPIAVGGCQAPAGARTTLPAEWRNPELSAEPFRTLFVIGIGRSDEYRRLYEDSMVHALHEEESYVPAAPLTSSDLYSVSERVAARMKEEGLIAP